MMRINKGRIIELQELRELQIRDHDNEKVSTNAFDSGRNKAPAEAKVKAIESTRNEENKELGGERIRHPQKMKIGAFVRWRDRAPDEATVKTLAGMRNEENEEHVEEHTRDPDEIQIGAPVEMQSNEIDEVSTEYLRPFDYFCIVIFKLRLKTVICPRIVIHF